MDPIEPITSPTLHEPIDAFLGDISSSEVLPIALDDVEVRRAGQDEFEDSLFVRVLQISELLLQKEAVLM